MEYTKNQMKKNNIYKSFQITIVIICLLLIFKIVFEEEEIKIF